MKARLTENPKDWRDFSGSMALMVCLIAGLLWWRGKVPAAGAVVAVTVALAVYGTAWARPRWFRGFYRVAKPLMHGIGQCMGIAILSVFYFLILTPLGLLMRLAGKRLFDLGRGGKGDSHWAVAKVSRSPRRMY